MHERAYCCKTVQTLQLFERARTVRFPTARLPRATWPCKQPGLAENPLALKFWRVPELSRATALDPLAENTLTLTFFSPQPVGLLARLFAVPLTRPPNSWPAYKRARSLARFTRPTNSWPAYKRARSLARFTRPPNSWPAYKRARSLARFTRPTNSWPAYTPAQPTACQLNSSQTVKLHPNLDILPSRLFAPLPV